MSEQKSTSIRPYGPGKFSTVLDSIVYEFSLDGCADETGDVDHGRHYARIDGPLFIADVPADVAADMTADELAELESAIGGAIVSCDSQGFVYVEYFATAEEITARWAECLEETADRYAVIVGNVGTVYDGTDQDLAEETYRDYCDVSRLGVGRAGNEPVTLTCNGEPIEDYDPANDDRLIALGFDRGSAGCSQCQALSINGTPTHESGCPNARHTCKGCDAMIPIRQRYCEDCAR